MVLNMCFALYARSSLLGARVARAGHRLLGTAIRRAAAHNTEAAARDAAEAACMPSPLEVPISLSHAEK